MKTPGPGRGKREAAPGTPTLFLSLLTLGVLFMFGAPLECVAQTKASASTLGNPGYTVISGGPVTSCCPGSLDSLGDRGDGYFSSPIPLSYQGEEPKKAADKESALRRGVIIAAGSFPFSYFYTNLAFDFVRYAVSGFDSLYAPWPFRSVGSVSIETEETFIRLGVGVGLSLAIGLADILSR